MTAKDHNKLLSIFIFVQSGLTLFTGILLVFMYGGIGAFLFTASRDSEGQAAGGLFFIIGIGIGVLIILTAAFYAFTAWKLLKEQSIGRILGIICCCFFLLGFPLGTALGVYGLWFLLGDLGKDFYNNYAGSFNSIKTPPPPQSWQ